MSFPGGSEVKASACNAGDLGSIPGSGRSPGEGNGNPLHDVEMEIYISFKIIYVANFIYLSLLFLAVLDLHCSTWAASEILVVPPWMEPVTPAFGSVESYTGPPGKSLEVYVS